MPERKVYYSETEPPSPNVGDSWIHTTTRVEKVWRGTVWKATAASIVVAEAEVFNGTSPASWTALDLSGVIGSNPALVMLKFDAVGDMNALAVRKKGDTDEFYGAAVESNAYGCALGHHDAGVHLVLLVATDDTGVIEWITESPQTATVDIIAYIK